jgi:hypothetical protein
MTECIGTPAELCALPYVEGTLPGNEMERFEEHFFDCPVCLEHLQAIQAASQGMARQPMLVKVKETKPAKVFTWSTREWALSAAAALLVTVGAVTYRLVESRPAQPTVAQTVPAETPPVEPVKRPQAKASQLADLMLPAFIAPNLRGASEDAHYQAGMKAYQQNHCASAAPELAQVPSQDPAALAAKFYTGACQMHLGNLTAASATLRAVAAKGDSPQQESALYYQAQIALARNDAATAHRLLQQTVALKGDLETRARTEDAKVADLLAHRHGAEPGKPAGK